MEEFLMDDMKFVWDYNETPEVRVLFTLIIKVSNLIRQKSMIKSADTIEYNPKFADLIENEIGPGLLNGLTLIPQPEITENQIFIYNERVFLEPVIMVTSEDYTINIIHEKTASDDNYLKYKMGLIGMITILNYPE